MWFKVDNYHIIILCISKNKTGRSACVSVWPPTVCVFCSLSLLHTLSWFSLSVLPVVCPPSPLLPSSALSPPPASFAFLLSNVTDTHKKNTHEKISLYTGTVKYKRFKTEPHWKSVIQYLWFINICMNVKSLCIYTTVHKLVIFYDVFIKQVT